MLEKVEGELFAFTEAMKKSPGFSYFLKNPTVSRGEKVKEVLLHLIFSFSSKQLLMPADTYAINSTNMTIMLIGITLLE